MKKTAIFITAALLSVFSLQAQVPSGFVKGSVTLTDGSTLSGFVKDNIKKNVSVTFVNDKGSGKQEFNGDQVNEVTIDGVTYRSIKGDFFKTISTGKIFFLQKASNTSSKPIYNGNEAIFAAGTEGKIGDYFSYSNNQLTLITKKSVDEFIKQLSASAEATEKAKAVNGNIAALADAVAIYNAANK